MTVKPAVLRELAAQDVEQIIDHYVAEAENAAAKRFIGALEEAFALLEQYPRMGSPRYAYELDLPGLRAFNLRAWPFIIFYVERDDHLDIWRVLHAHRDIPGWMQDPDGLEKPPLPNRTKS